MLCGLQGGVHANGGGTQPLLQLGQHKEIHLCHVHVLTGGLGLRQGEKKSPGLSGATSCSAAKSNFFNGLGCRV